jgi:thiamine-monophosphate kinase
VELGLGLAPLVHAMMDVSDGLLIDAARMAHASGLSVTVELTDVPLSQALQAMLGGERQARLDASTAGDDYELLFAAAAGATPRILEIAECTGVPLSRIGRLEVGAGLQLTDSGVAVPLPDRLGYEHARDGIGLLRPELASRSASP